MGAALSWPAPCRFFITRSRQIAASVHPVLSLRRYFSVAGGLDDLEMLDGCIIARQRGDRLRLDHRNIERFTGECPDRIERGPLGRYQKFYSPSRFPPGQPRAEETRGCAELGKHIVAEVPRIIIGTGQIGSPTP